jgi:hypothetical protein
VLINGFISKTKENIHQELSKAKRLERQIFYMLWRKKTKGSKDVQHLTCLLMPEGVNLRFSNN